MPSTKSLSSVKQAAAVLGVHPETIRRWLRAGAPAAKGIGRTGRWIIEPERLLAWLENRRRSN